MDPQLVTPPTQKGTDFYWLNKQSLKIILEHNGTRRKGGHQRMGKHNKWYQT